MAGTGSGQIPPRSPPVARFGRPGRPAGFSTRWKPILPAAVLRYIKGLCLIIRATLWRICSGLQRPSRQDGRRDPPRKLFLALVELRSLEQTSRRARLGLMPWSSFLFQLLCEVLSYSGFSFARLLRLGERVRVVSPKHAFATFQRQSVEPLGPGQISFRLQHLGQVEHRRQCVRVLLTQ